VAGLLCRCPHCGRGALFKSRFSLGVREACPVCGFDLRRVDTGDGPAVFVTLIGGGVGVFGMLLTEAFYRPPIWVHFVVWLPLTLLLSLGLLKPFKGVLCALQFANDASESRHGP
jgi:uncharacterized protein (DUF983 family)